MPIKHNLSWHKRKTWDEFSKFIRYRDWKAQGELYLDDIKVARCFTCSKLYPIEGKGTMQAGHFIPGRKNHYLFDEKQVHAQCYNCNVNLKGNWPNYLENMILKYGVNETDKILAERKTYKKYTIPELEELREFYKSKLNDKI